MDISGGWTNRDWPTVYSVPWLQENWKTQLCGFKKYADLYKWVKRQRKTGTLIFRKNIFRNEKFTIKTTQATKHLCRWQERVAKTKRLLAGVQKIALLDEKIGKWSWSQMNKWKKEKLESHTLKMDRESGDTNNLYYHINL